MDARIITIETRKGPQLMILQRIMRMVPEGDKDDTDLKRLVAFRLMTDGESTTKQYLMDKIRSMIQSSYSGSLLDWLRK